MVLRKLGSEGCLTSGPIAAVYQATFVCYVVRVKVLYSNHYEVNLDGHPWHTSKYRLILERLRSEGIVAEVDVVQSEMVDDEDLLRVHTYFYWQELCDLNFSPEQVARAGLPITTQTVDLFWRFAGGTLQASEHALKDGVAVHLGGGFHHAFDDHATGFCLINDIAISVRTLMDRDSIQRPLIIDCDAHQGDATARIFRNDSSVFTFSMHAKRNFPYLKQQSSLDVELENGISDDEYLSELKNALDSIFTGRSRFDFIHYQAGADPGKNDLLGGLALTAEGLKARDRMVMERAVSMGLPIVVTLGGGYTADVRDVVEIHFNTVCVAAGIANRNQAD